MKQFINTSLLTIAIAGAATLTAAPGVAAAPANRASVADVEQFIGPDSRPQGAPAMTFMADGKTYASLSADRRTIEIVDLASGKTLETVFDASNTRENKIDRIDSFTFSPDGKRILIATETAAIYRHSTTAEHYVYEIRSRLLQSLSTEHGRQRAPLFSPDGLMVAFVAADNNIYLKKLTYGTEVAVTTDGSVNNVINGVPDWVYEEEFTTSSSMTWSPDSRTLCYIRYDESSVPMFALPVYDGVCGDHPENLLYPGAFIYKYPVAGEKNSVVSVHSYDIDNRVNKQIALPEGNWEYIPRIAFAHDNERLMVETLNRAQNRLEIFVANPRSTVARSIMVEESKAWLNPATYEEITWEEDGFVILSGRTGYDHLYRYNYNGVLTTTISSGNFDVTAYYGHDDATGSYYFQSTSGGSINRVINRVDRKGAMTTVSAPEGTSSARFTPDMSSYLLTYSSAATPPGVSVCNTRSGKTVRTLVDNSKGSYAQRWQSAPQREFFTIRSEGGVELNAYMIKPAGFDPSRRYPVVMYQYSGPGSQTVKNQWGIDWQHYFASQGYIIVAVDGRGTGFRGRAFMDVVYKNLGHYETIDQIAAARHVASLPYVDSKRIGIHGWSYGGYETLMASSAENAPYAAAVAVAPVTSWRFYDTIYAERYMLTPQENESGYESSAPINRTALVNCPLLIMWGTADDNVHPENTIEFMSAMERGGNYCDLLLFPNMDHSIRGCGTRALVYARMLDYFNNNMR